MPFLGVIPFLLLFCLLRQKGNWQVKAKKISFYLCLSYDNLVEIRHHCLDTRKSIKFDLKSHRSPLSEHFGVKRIRSTQIGSPTFFIPCFDLG